MERFLSAIEQSVQNNNWYAAVTLSLVVPDVCGWLENPEVTSRRRYEAWFDKYLLPFYKTEFHGPDFAFLTSGDCYALRCAFLHEGSDQIARQKASEVLSKIMFSITGSHLIQIEDILVLNVQRFCAEVCSAARKWIREKQGDQEVQARMKELIQIQIEGFSPSPGVFMQ